MMDALDKMLDDAQTQQYSANILAKFAQTDGVLRAAGAAWYQAAHDDCARIAARHGFTLEQVAGAAAAISPGMRWDLVLGYVERLIGSKRKRAASVPFNVPTYSKLFVDRALQCLHGKREPLEVLGGPKVTAFYRLIVDPTNAHDVCVDGHAFNIAKGERTNIRGEGSEGLRLTEKRYRMVAEAYRRAAASAGILPHQMQAITWVQHRKIDQHSADLPF